MKREIYKVIHTQELHPSFPGIALLREEWRRANKTHRVNAPAVTVRRLDTGDEVELVYYERDDIHRLDGPAQVKVIPHNKTRVESWFQRGKPHRVGGPSSTLINRAGFVLFEQWNEAGNVHRSDGPAMISRSADTGVVTDERWYIEGRRHRIGGPAIIRRDPTTGIADFEVYYRNDLPHRDDGPARIDRDGQSGRVTYIEYHHHGRLLFARHVVDDELDSMMKACPQ